MLSTHNCAQHPHLLKLEVKTGLLAVMSSNGETNVVLRGVTHGAVDFLIKPVRIEELRNVWQHVVRRKRDQVVIVFCLVSACCCMYLHRLFCVCSGLGTLILHQLKLVYMSRPFGSYAKQKSKLVFCGFSLVHKAKVLRA